MSIKFEKGQIYHTVKTLGVVKKQDGRYQISQRVGKDGPDITKDEDLTFVEREAGKLWFTRSDGTRVVGHRSHFDAEDAYNLSKEDNAKNIETLKNKLAKKNTELAQAQAKMEALVAEEAALQNEAAPDPVSSEARDQAALLFDEA